MIAIESKRRKREIIPDAVIADVTSQATDGLVKISYVYSIYMVESR